MLLIGVTLLVLAAWYVFVTAADGGPLAMRIVLAATGCSLGSLRRRLVREVADEVLARLTQ